MSANERSTTSGAAAGTCARSVGLFPDYNSAAIAYWWLLTAAGAAAIAVALRSVAALPGPAIGQIAAVSLIAALIAVFPLRIPKSKNSIAAGDIFIFLLLLLHGPAAAVIAAASEATVCVWRTSSRWSSRIASPAAAALAMLVCGTAFDLGLALVSINATIGDGVLLGALLLFAAAYFVVSPTLITTVIYLKRGRGPTFVEWLSSFGWVGMGYVASASVAGVLFLAFREFGIATVMIAAPMIALFLTTLHYYFAQQESAERETAERASRERAEAAQREAAQAARHLRELERADRRFQSAFTHAAIGMALVARDGTVVQANRSMCTLVGRDSSAVVGTPFINLVDRRDTRTLQAELRRVDDGEIATFQIELRCLRADGGEVWVSLHCGSFADASVSGSQLIIQAFDVSARRLAEDRLQHLAFYDALTGLANRSSLHEAVNKAIEAGRTSASNPFSLMHLNFDRFKLLNESLGHGAGDEFLVKVARRLREHVRPSDVVARLGADEFVILTVHRGGDAQHAVALAQRLQDAFRKPVVVCDTEVSTGVSIGITVSDIGYRSAEDMLRDADLAMSKAKASGKARYALFDSSLHERATVQLQLENDLRRALDTNQVSLVFQPVFDMRRKRMVGFEALARWQHPQRGSISPATFIPVAEESGMIVGLTRMAIERACLQLRAWRQRYPQFSDLFVNVNISGQDICEASFADRVRDALEQYALPPSCLTLEITENTLMQQLAMAGGTLDKLRRLGVGLSIDDFGTGYSSLSHLSSLPISSLKIDRSFVSRLDSGGSEAEIVRAVIQLGDALGKRIIAEGIENAEQAIRLIALGGTYGQGYYLARPLTVAQVGELLSDASDPAAAWADTITGPVSVDGERAVA